MRPTPDSGSGASAVAPTFPSADADAEPTTTVRPVDSLAERLGHPADARLLIISSDRIGTTHVAHRLHDPALPRPGGDRRDRGGVAEGVPLRPDAGAQGAVARRVQLPRRRAPRRRPLRLHAAVVSEW